MNSHKPLICIDPGHGGSAPGVVGIGGVKEADINLQIAKKLLETCCRGDLDCFLTRTEDSSVSLYERSRLCREKSADLFVSIHCNGFKNPAAEGIEVLYGNYGGRSKALANYIFQSIIKLYGSEHIARGIVGSPSKKYPRTLYVLRTTPCPAVLVETEFITNPKWSPAWITDEAVQYGFSEAIYEGLRHFLNSG